MEEDTVLIVEREILIRQPLAEYLRKCGFRVLEAVDPAEARVILGVDRARVDIVLADLETLGEDGFALAQWIRRNLPAVDVILAGTVKRVVEKAGDVCQDGPALAKPYEHQLVLKRIRQTLAARSRGPKI